MSDQVMNWEDDQVYAYIHEALAAIQWDDLGLTDWGYFVCPTTPRLVSASISPNEKEPKLL